MGKIPMSVVAKIKPGSRRINQHCRADMVPRNDGAMAGRNPVMKPMKRQI